MGQIAKRDTRARRETTSAKHEFFRLAFRARVLRFALCSANPPVLQANPDPDHYKGTHPKCKPKKFVLSTIL